jgi:hypothetical protein
VNKEWNHINVNALSEKESIIPASMEEYIFEHYYGHTKSNEAVSLEYQVKHPSWKINEVLHYEINSDFQHMYGDVFSFLNKQNPDSVFLAEGSPVSVIWQREIF